MTTIEDATLREAVSAAVEQAMDAMFFDAAEPACECTGAGAADCVTAAVRFHDFIEGEFLLTMPRQTAVALAASFMALDPEAVDAAHSEQTVCELANIICGAALSRLDPSAELRLSPPEVVAGSCGLMEWGVWQHYRLLDGCMSVSIRLTP